MNLTAWLAQHDGIAHNKTVATAGFTRYSVRAALESGAAQRIRRDWIALPTTPDELRLAAQAGGRLSCLSAAQRLGLWHLGDGLTHLSVNPRSGHVTGDGLILHWSAGPAPTRPYSLLEPIENVLVHLARCQPFENALAVWDSALNHGLVSEAHLARLPLRSVAARRLRSACSSLSDSGLETIPVARLAALGVTVRQQVFIEGHRVDGLIGERLVLQIDGFAHHRDAVQRRSDIAHDRALALLGYTVFRYDYKQILFEWPRVEAEILRAMAQQLHLDAQKHAR
ncbi:hypothetical protein ASC66_03030 [Leifsonia sp. Root4]|uniref:endonuclease domain-containing protein n=1 Tax=Leifsonia sp. Root4 TaxID=1736525 RepID=UPI0007017E5E|nr:DUF559 domain-containing protein [Leifsonia sp. Root4]KQW07946.1 hypothetical protein ASC66_03030 [Leifsonia sp. Root4]